MSSLSYDFWKVLEEAHGWNSDRPSFSEKDRKEKEMKMGHITISPAYGRDYKNGKAAQMDFDQGKDFRDESLSGGGRVCNKEDLQNAGIKEVHIRYKKLTMVKVVKL